MYRPKEIRCRLHTGGKTVAEIKERYTGQGLTYRGFESLQRAFDLFDGQEINLFKRERGGEEVNEPDPPSIESAAPPKWRQIREKRARRRKGARKP